jgi:hypothetical protein
MLNVCFISVSSCDDINIHLFLQGRIHDSGTGVTYRGNGEQALDCVSNRRGKLRLEIWYFGINSEKKNSFVSVIPCCFFKLLLLPH